MLFANSVALDFFAKVGMFYYFRLYYPSFQVSSLFSHWDSLCHFSEGNV